MAKIREANKPINMTETLVFKTYPDLLQAQQAAELLQQHDIEAEVTKEARILDSVYIGQQFTDPYLLSLPGKDFERAEIILEESITIKLNEVDPDYLLLSFSNEELIEVMKKKEEWGAFNYKLAESLLTKRGVPIPEMDIIWSQVEHLKEKEQPTPSGMLLLLLGYSSLISGMLIAFRQGGHLAFTLFPGFLALLIGWHLAYNKRTLSNGNQIHYFNERTRLHGTIMLWLSVIVAVARFILALIIILEES